MQKWGASAFGKSLLPKRGISPLVRNRVIYPSSYASLTARRAAIYRPTFVYYQETKLEQVSTDIKIIISVVSCIQIETNIYGFIMWSFLALFLSWKKIHVTKEKVRVKEFLIH